MRDLDYIPFSLIWVAGNRDPLLTNLLDIRSEKRLLDLYLSYLLVKNQNNDDHKNQSYKIYGKVAISDEKWILPYRDGARHFNGRGPNNFFLVGFKVWIYIIKKYKSMPYCLNGHLSSIYYFIFKKKKAKKKKPNLIKLNITQFYIFIIPLKLKISKQNWKESFWKRSKENHSPKIQKRKNKK